MRAVNTVILRGELSSDLLEGRTSQGESACSFILKLPKEEGYACYVRVNVYGEHVSFCKNRLRRDCLVLVQGELMNRVAKTGHSFTEVRCLDVTSVE